MRTSCVFVFLSPTLLSLSHHSQPPLPCIPTRPCPRFTRLRFVLWHSKYNQGYLCELWAGSTQSHLVGTSVHTQRKPMVSPLPDWITNSDSAHNCDINGGEGWRRTDVAFKDGSSVLNRLPNSAVETSENPSCISSAPMLKLASLQI